MHEENGEIRSQDSLRLAGNWWDAVTGIAFGGLVPQTTQTLRDAVLFTTSGLYDVVDNLGQFQIAPLPNAECSCDEALEHFINKVHRRRPGSQLFGKYVADRGNWTDANYAISCQNTRDAAAVFGRYMTLLERLTALCVEDGTGIIPEDPLKMDSVFDKACELLRQSYIAAKQTYRLTNSDPPVDSPTAKAIDAKLGRIVKSIENEFEVGGDYRIPVSRCAWIVACILAAWAKNVQLIKLKSRRTTEVQAMGFGLENRGTVLDNVTERTSAALENMGLEDLPSIMAFG